ncbi:MAG: type III pantothenate kinase [Bacteroidetes bacterium]|nr:MAG: type III pantothenate kinase [Bacteroidota bacterium]
MKKMPESNKILVVDAGNTSVKVAIFIDDEVYSVNRTSLAEFKESLLNKKFSEINKSALCSVLIEQDTKDLLSLLPNATLINTSIKSDLSSEYKSMATLGVDRWCNAVAIHALKEDQSAISIDIGTCVKFDAVIEGTYIGGSISPGIDLRYRALNNFTAALPLLDFKTMTALTGDSTNSSIHSGVVNGILSEINGMIERYEQSYKGLTFFVTGGDAQYFDFGGKNNIFVDENLTLKGIYQLYKLNA